MGPIPNRSPLKCGWGWGKTKEILAETAEAASGFGGVVRWRADPGSAGDTEPRARQGSGLSPPTGGPWIGVSGQREGTAGG